ncbi:MAG: hypothetical protein GY727_14025 [Gammaproteobacteria bacterium]|nr:hypothetical protein [Gammaproteobacteria bacterium]MCP4091078.1 hypothetical protein [Gammaproteobacteria bacterium]MCP4277396.1 hypothetical protein [Gammaproteobacteria bacterium]MCP4831543.1 hypothetical protein [Gammaproteobacteria bacterium]MCP4927766.1 hypothetical protein [Gammaproteobacteria bacterium]
MKKNLTYKLLIAGLLALSLIMPWWLLINTTSLGTVWSIIFGSGIPALLLYATGRKIRNWSGITALIMIPYAVIGIMEVVATLGALNSGMALAIISIGNFFTALDAGRRNP